MSHKEKWKGWNLAKVDSSVYFRSFTTWSSWTRLKRKELERLNTKLWILPNNKWKYTHNWFFVMSTMSPKSPSPLTHSHLEWKGNLHVYVVPIWCSGQSVRLELERPRFKSLFCHNALWMTSDSLSAWLTSQGCCENKWEGRNHVYYYWMCTTLNSLKGEDH